MPWTNASPLKSNNDKGSPGFPTARMHTQECTSSLHSYQIVAATTVELSTPPPDHLAHVSQVYEADPGLESDEDWEESLHSSAETLEAMDHMF